MGFEILPIENGVCAPSGFIANGVSAGLKKDNLLDVGYIYMTKPCYVSAIFTNNTFKAAPIRHFTESVKGKKSNFILVNTKNANAMTGQKGIEDIKYILQHLQDAYPNIQNPISASTGVIGVYMPKDKIINAFSKIDFTIKEPSAFAMAIKTTDRFHKEIALKITLDDGKSFNIGAAAKGAGMINPSLATMLCFITTDADVPEGVGEEILKECAVNSFESISVDGDTSTNDSVFLCASGDSGVWDRDAFVEGLKIVMSKLATDIVRDGEGSSKVVGFQVNGALNEQEAKKAAKALATSLLVKTALFGCDPNWGRIASTIGASGVKADEKSLKISIGDICVYENENIYFDEQIEQKCFAIMKQDSFYIKCDLGVGDGAFTSLACDLGYKYVEINSDYRS